MRKTRGERSQGDHQRGPFVLSKDDERRYGGEIVAIDHWPKGNRYARVITSGDTVEEVVRVMKMRFGNDVKGVAHCNLREERIPCIMTFCKSAERKERRR